MKLFDRLKINEEFIYTGSSEEFEKDLKILENKDILIQRIDEQKIKFKPTFSWGTGLSSGGIQIAEGINVIALTKQINEKLLKLNLTIKIRFEHYFIAIFYILFIVIMIVQKEKIWVYFFLLGLWIIFHLWFHWVYRIQERAVIKKW